ncbi:MAG: hypothetical protein A2186_01020 [Candidatus Levybacteria bacterium RIFOXYA1_FULL_41_10]|nr:MAG: hypothetical protein UT44_C0012G0017 [Candidatus Levybacteria bacterium GW2011_GWA1_39_32]KKR50684.1 MAG: hypothetical protein UT87_C0014G0040 [Candidatus Levybacteria bacterium GW2011_GWC1_40_19]KKR71966.1 MAG: hypothetical protein UU15_C0038G0006 [Candidatus Levybacteria bacterium GW2011_GWC2_40_7]KKR95370.1 MAG: hypothetical protein UU45_C0002G0082 [Candidatus Levybacteria bacterium GW2011_GWA2_41_15]KKS02138.1 MAG: hypothetical protein UU52_C0003G0015 [Candidatus Levybacteria bacter
MGGPIEKGAPQTEADTAPRGSLFTARIFEWEMGVYKAAGRSIQGLCVEFVSAKADRVRLRGFRDHQVLLVVTHDKAVDFTPYLQRVQELRGQPKSGTSES